jgi:hypothetical protein
MGIGRGAALEVAGPRKGEDGDQFLDLAAALLAADLALGGKAADQLLEHVVALQASIFVQGHIVPQKDILPHLTAPVNTSAEADPANRPVYF